MRDMTTEQEQTRIEPQRPIVDAKWVGKRDGSGYYVIEIFRWRKENGETVITHRHVIGEYKTRQKAERQAAMIRGAILDAVLAELAEQRRENGR